MAVERITVSLDSSLAADVRRAADAESQTVSAWLAEAARAHLVARGLDEVVREWEDEHGPFTAAELAEARSALRVKDLALADQELQDAYRRHSADIDLLESSATQAADVSPDW